MNPSTVSEQVDAATASVLGVSDYLERLHPDSEAGSAELSRLRTYRPGDRADWREELRALRNVEDWMEGAPEARERLRELFSRLPAIDVPVRKLESGSNLDDGDLFDLKQFGYFGRRILEESDPLPDLLDAPSDGIRHLDRLVRTLHPGGENSPQFHLSGELDETLRERLDRMRRIDSNLENLREELRENVVEEIGGSCGLRGQFRPPDDVDADELAAHPHLERRDDAWVLVSERLRELESDAETAREKLEEAERRVRGELSDSLRTRVDWLEPVADFLAALDVRIAKIRMKWETDGCWAEWRTDDGSPLEIVEGREPRIESHLRESGESIQPIDFETGRRPGVVTGPNMGGKSALLSLIGICQWCAQHACPVPASEFAFEPVASIVYVGSEEPDAVDASRGLSSFGREVRRLVDASETADRPVLWLLDEVGRGTHPDDGAALARDLLRAIADRGDRAVAATHFPNLAQADGFDTYRIRGLRDTDSLDPMLDDAAPPDSVETALRDAMDFQPERRTDGAVPRDARRVARALGLEFDEA